MLLPYGESTVIETLIQTMLTVCSEAIVVTGHYHEALFSKLSGSDKVTIVRNEAYERGMFSSVQVGAEAATDNIMLIPGDHPAVKEATLKALIASDGQVRVPVSDGRRGHPIFISGSLLKSLREEPKDSNLKVFRNKQKVTYIEVKDHGIYSDVDTMEDYKRLVSKKDAKHPLK